MAVAKEIEDVNREVTFMIHKLQQFIQNHNVIDSHLSIGLTKLVDKIKNFLDGSPNIKSFGDTSFDNRVLDVHKVTIQRSFYCQVCNCNIVSRNSNIYAHCNDKKHVKKLTKFALNQSQQNLNNEKKNNNLILQNIPPENRNIRKVMIEKQLKLEEPLGPQVAKPLESQVAKPLELQIVKSLGSQKTNENNKNRELVVQKKIVKNPLVPDVLTFVEDLNKETKKLLSKNIEEVINEQIEIGMEILTTSANRNITDSLDELLAPHFKSVQVYTFGSRSNGTGSPESDLDIYIDINNTYNDYSSSSNSRMKRNFDDVMKILRTDGKKEWRNLEPIRGARVPIIKAENLIHGIDCDLSFRNGLGHCNTQLITYFFNLQPVFKKLVVFLKMWSKTTRLSTNITNYTFILLALFYFQSKKLLPSVMELQTDIYNFYIGPWIGNIASKTLEELNIPKSDNIQKHLIGFFEFYANMGPFGDQVISPYLGRLIPKNVFENPYDFEDLKLYTDYLDNDENDRITRTKFSYKSIMCVQDPFDLSHNVAKGVKVQFLVKFIGYCSSTANLLK